AEVRVATPGFFDALGLPVVLGRGITGADRPGTTKIAVVNRAFAARFFPNENAIGQAISIGWGEEDNGTMREIVGVVGDVHSAALADAPEPTIYTPAIQSPHHGLTLVVSTTGSISTLVNPLRSIV